MKIALDHDGTYTRDPELWDEFIKLANARGHQVVCVTMRGPHEGVAMPCEVIYTSRKAKAGFYPADVWIDDQPQFLFVNG